MRKCSNCNADIPDGEYFCPVCLEPVQLVPDYETIESREQENELRKKEEEERRREEERIARERALERSRVRKQRIMMTVFVLTAVVLAVLIFVVLNHKKKTGSFEYQYRMAMEAFDSGSFGDALEYVNEALSIQPDNQDAGLLLGMIYEKMEDPEKAAEAYARVIEKHPDFVKAYDALVPLYAGMQSYDKLQELIEGISDQSIHDRYLDYLVYDVTFSLEPGTYDEEKELELKSEGKGVIYYTLDGTEPTESSLRYHSKIALKEGETLVRAKYVSPQHIPGEPAEGKYMIQLEKPSAPVITPRSGTYSSVEPVKITVEVPAGYTAYYSFDRRADKNSTRYTQPVDMPAGDHIFYAVLVNSKGKEGDVASATYIYKKLNPTPTPTPKQTYPSSVISADAEETPEPTPTPTETPEPTPTPTPAETPEPTAEPTAAPTDAPEEEPSETPSPNEETDNTEE